jgi:hypothetical protein
MFREPQIEGVLLQDSLRDVAISKNPLSRLSKAYLKTQKLITSFLSMMPFPYTCGTAAGDFL